MQCLICNLLGGSKAIWKSLDLDSILTYCDQLYKQLNKAGLLSVEDLPNSVDTGITGQSFAVEMLSNESGILTNDETSTSIRHLHNTCRDTGNGALFFINNYTFSLIWSKEAFFYLMLIAVIMMVASHQMVLPFC